MQKVNMNMELRKFIIFAIYVLTLFTNRVASVNIRGAADRNMKHNKERRDETAEKSDGSDWWSRLVNFKSEINEKETPKLGKIACLDLYLDVVPFIGNLNFLENPVEILASDTDTVTFTISQKLKKSGAVRSLATVYSPIPALDGGAGRDDEDGSTDTILTCDSSHDVRWSTSRAYKAKCVDSYAHIQLFAHDFSFASARSSVVASPSSCNDPESSGADYFSVGFNITIPCSCSEDQ